MAYHADRRRYGERYYYTAWFPILDLPGVYLKEEPSPDMLVPGPGMPMNIGRIEDFDTRQRRQMKEWWDSLKDQHGEYPCFGVLLLLPGDEEAFQYIREYAREFDLLSGINCLVIVVGRFDREPIPSSNDDDAKGILSKEERMFMRKFSLVFEDYAYKGNSINVSKLFGKSFDEFTAFIVFRDILSPEHVLINLKGLVADDISATLRRVFSTIDDAISSGKDPLDLIEKRHARDIIQKTGRTVIGTARSFAGQAFQKAMEAWINTMIK